MRFLRQCEAAFMLDIRELKELVGQLNLQDDLYTEDEMWTYTLEEVLFREGVLNVVKTVGRLGGPMTHYYPYMRYIEEKLHGSNLIGHMFSALREDLPGALSKEAYVYVRGAVLLVVFP